MPRWPWSSGTCRRHGPRTSPAARSASSSRWSERIDAAGTSPPTWIRDADRTIPVDLDLGDQRQEHGHPAHHPHPPRDGPTRRDDDLGRGPRRRADDRPGRLDRARRRPPDPRPARRRRRGPRDRPRRHRPARRRLRVERGERPDQRLVRPPRPAGDPHAARAGRGEGHDLPDHEARWLGRAQRRRRARRGRGAPGPGARGVLLAGRAVTARATARGGGRTRLPRPRRMDRRGRRRPRDAGRRGRPGPDHDRRAGPLQRRERARRVRRRAGDGRDASPRCTTGCSTSGRRPSARRAA